MKKVKGCIVRGGTYYSNIRVPEVLRTPDGAEKLRRSLDTSDPDVAALRIARLKEDLNERKRAQKSQADVEALVDTLPADQRRLYAEAGGIEGLIKSYWAMRTSRQFLIAGEPTRDDHDDSDNREDLEVELDMAAHAATVTVATDRLNTAAEALTPIGYPAQPVGDVFGLRELVEK